MENNPILRELTDADIAKFVAAGDVRKMNVGTDIMREGVESPSLYILLSGKLAVVVGSPPKELAELHAGEIVGEMSFVDQRSSSAIVRVTEEAELLVVSRDSIEVMIANDPAMGARFFRGIARLVVRRLRSTILHLGYNQKNASPEVQLDRRLLDSVAKRRKPAMAAK